MTNLIAVNTQIAGITKNGLSVGGFKLLSVSNTVNQVVWFKDVDGTAKATRDDKGNVIREDIPGFTLYFAYKNQSKNWTGSLVETKGELLPTKSCLKLEIVLPKQLNTQSKLYKFLVFLGEIEPLENSVTNEEDLIDDTEDNGNLNLEDLGEDTENNAENLDLSLSIDDIQTILFKYINKIFIAPFSKTERNYPQLIADFSNWELKK